MDRKRTETIGLQAITNRSATAMLLVGTFLAAPGCDVPVEDPALSGGQQATLLDEGSAESVDSTGLTASQAAGLEARINDQLKATPGGVRISLNEIAWHDGDVVMTIGLPNGIGAQAHGPCDAGWYCVYEAWYWNEVDKDTQPHLRKLRFRDCRAWGYVNNLRDYDFHNKTSSWDNRSSRRVQALDDARGVLWTMQPHSRSAEVNVNDEADKLKAFCL
jgi:hypothetical protein